MTFTNPNYKQTEKILGRGKAKNPRKGFGSMDKDKLRELSKRAGAIGGKKSTRRGKVNVKA